MRRLKTLQPTMSKLHCRNKEEEPTVLSDERESNKREKKMQQFHAYIQHALKSELFPRIDLASCSPVLSLAQLSRQSAIIELKNVFEAASLPIKFGFSQSTQEITISISLKGVERIPVIETPETAIIWLMLGLAPFQEELELYHYSLTYRKEASRILNTAPTTAGVLEPVANLANECLHYFAIRTGVAITKRTLTIEHGYVSLSLDSFIQQITRSKDGQIFTDNMKKPFRFSPFYFKMSPLGIIGEAGSSDSKTIVKTDSKFECPVRFKFDESLRIQREDEFIHFLIDEFWRLVSLRRYYPDENVKAKSSELLFSFLKSGIRGHHAVFQPKDTNFTLYLHGTAGVGKTHCLQIQSLKISRKIELRHAVHHNSS
jgi:hypothetical protein